MSGISGKVHISTDDGATYNEMDGIKSHGFKPAREMLDVTDTKDGDGSGNGWRKFKAGLKDGGVDLSGDLEEADANGQNALRTAWENGTEIKIRLEENPAAVAGKKGYDVPCLVESYEVNGEVGGTVEFSATLKINGAPAAW